MRTCPSPHSMYLPVEIIADAPAGPDAAVLLLTNDAENLLLARESGLNVQRVHVRAESVCSIADYCST